MLPYPGRCKQASPDWISFGEIKLKMPEKSIAIIVVV